MNFHLFRPLEFERFDSLEFDGIKTGDRQCTSNCGESATIGSGRRASNPVEFDGVGTSRHLAREPGSGLQISFLALRMEFDVNWNGGVERESVVDRGAKNEI